VDQEFLEWWSPPDSEYDDDTLNSDVGLKMATNTAIERPPYVASSGFTIADMLTPCAYRHPVNRMRLCETNISWVVLTGLYAYKIKKNVCFDFIDASTLAKRHHLCEEELRLNRRLSPALYQDVVPITREPGGLRVDGEGVIVDYAVRMRQFEASQELSALLDHRDVDQRELADLGLRLARFHEDATAATFEGNFPRTAQLHDAVLGNLATLLCHLDGVAALPELGYLIDWTHDYLRDSLPQLRMREQRGAIRECHGDLHARNIARWEGQLLPFDCLEFDPKLRWIDVMNDAAFLVMDLTAHGRKDLAAAFLNAYLERTGDYDGVRHLPFYSVYRALVRAMVDSLAVEGDAARRREFQVRLRKRVKAAAEYATQPTPTLFIMHGPSGSGKSWLSERLALSLGAVRIRSDVERKRLGGAVSMSGGGRAGFEEGLYEPAMSHRTYAHLLECAESCLRGGMNTIVDAAFLKKEHRRLFRDLAARQGFGFIILSCEADSTALTKRVRERAEARVGPSDAGLDVLEHQLKSQERLDADEQFRAIEVETTQPLACEKAVVAISDRLSSARLSLPTT
jgi:aminoglycoside phosphotransferase family enzyme/predicted kinase